MHAFRNTFTRRLITFLAGLTFVNMGFIIAEVEALGLNKRSSLVQNIINTGAEEEESSPETSEDDAFTEIDLSLHDPFRHDEIILFNTSKRNHHTLTISLSSGYYKNFSPPPEINII
jgi:hypothetical protein